jgi:hypothetical protein
LPSIVDARVSVVDHNQSLRHGAKQDVVASVKKAIQP